MSLTLQLLKKVTEQKKVAQDEMAVPKYDNAHTPDNHVGKKKTKVVADPSKGLDQRKDKKPTANVGSTHKERGRDMEGPKQKPKKMTEAQHPALQDLGIMAKRGGMISWHHPASPEQHYDMEWTPERHKQLVGILRQAQDTQGVWDLLMHWYENQDEGGDPRNQIGLAASTGAYMESNGVTGNPIMQQMSAVVNKDGTALKVTAPDGSAAMIVPMSRGLGQNINAFLRDPDNRQDTEAAANKLFRALSKIQGAQAAKPSMGGARSQGASIKSKGVSPDAGAGLSLEPMAAGVGGFAESAHKTADGEMPNPSVSKDGPARKAKTRSGKQPDEPVNKGNPGTGKEEKGQPKKQFSMSPKDFKGGENEHKSMAKMHEAVKDLETLLGRKLELKGTKTG